MKKSFLVLLVCLVIATDTLGQGINAIWANTSAGDKIASDPLGNVYSMNMGEPFLYKYDSGGNFLWSKTSGGSSFSALDVCTDKNNNVYIAASFFGTVTFGSQTLTSTSTNYSNLCVIKFNSDGDLIWSLVTAESNYASIKGIAVDGTGNVYFVGDYTSNYLTIGETTLSSIGTTGETFIVKLDSNGNILWAKGSDSGTFAKASGVALDNEDKPYLTGYYGTTVYFEDVPTISTGITMDSYDDIFLVKYDTDGSALWAANVPGTGFDDMANDITSDADGNIYLCGQFAESKFAIIKYNRDGSFLWNRVSSGTNQSMANSIAVDADGYIYVAGYFNGSDISFNSSNPIVIQNENSESLSQILLVKYEQDESLEMVRAISVTAAGGDQTDVANSICLSGSSVFIAGYFYSDELTLGNITLTGNFGSDFFAKIKNDATPVLSASNKKVLSLFPNPTHGEIRFVGLDYGTYQIKLNTLSGKCIYQAEINDVNATINLSGYPRGLYLVEISNEKNFSGIGKLMIE